MCRFRTGLLIGAEVASVAAGGDLVADADVGPVGQRHVTASATRIGEALDLPIDAAGGVGAVGGDRYGPPGPDVAPCSCATSSPGAQDER